jgi:hypothetical protein
MLSHLSRGIRSSPFSSGNVAKAQHSVRIQNYNAPVRNIAYNRVSDSAYAMVYSNDYHAKLKCAH